MNPGCVLVVGMKSVSVVGFLISEVRWLSAAFVVMPDLRGLFGAALAGLGWALLLRTIISLPYMFRINRVLVRCHGSPDAYLDRRVNVWNDFGPNGPRSNQCGDLEQVRYDCELRMLQLNIR